MSSRQENAPEVEVALRATLTRGSPEAEVVHEVGEAEVAHEEGEAEVDHEEGEAEVAHKEGGHLEVKDREAEATRGRSQSQRHDHKILDIGVAMT